MKIRELIFSQSQWSSKLLWDSIQTELGGKTIYIPKINVQETKCRNELIRELFHRKNKSINQLAEEFNLCRERIWQIIKQGRGDG